MLNIINYYIVITVIKLINNTADKVFLIFCGVKYKYYYSDQTKFNAELLTGI